jgi:hypothetical protein
MSEPAFREDQLKGLYAPHVKPINKLVDELRVDQERWVPHVAPLQAGVNARLLWLGSDPGPLPPAAGRPYDGLLSVEGDDAGSARIGALLKRAGIDVAETCPWNACPWYVDREPNATQLKAGLEPLRRIFNLLEELEVLILLGKVAERSWRMFASTYPDDTGWCTVLTTHEADDAGFVGTNAERQQRREAQAETFIEAGRLLRENG